ncbi:hypothetical protein E2562_038982 [Oryza meyeriana var. granulata]|uniref:Peptidase A1 domain-containing protein n=1 Tax=Oryza meyeriana var. granulata TaxID=110450 RepID=A0A6G1FGX4_9ORYZ|nr:hypothetical protein E2562_038982 [Oryza meyeriana var. granulata]
MASLLLVVLLVGVKIIEPRTVLQLQLVSGATEDETEQLWNRNTFDEPRRHRCVSDGLRLRIRTLQGNRITVPSKKNTSISLLILLLVVAPGLGTSAGSSALHCPASIYVKLGTPSVQYLVTFDTGSTLFWVQCKPCSIKCHNQPVKVGPIFDPSKSSMFRCVGCSTSICSYLRSTLGIKSKACMEWEDTCLYILSYGGWAYTVGKVVLDKLVLVDQAAGDAETTLSLANFVFGCSMDTLYGVQREAGIFGLGSNNYSFFE